jgi:hypothetical protein
MRATAKYRYSEHTRHKQESLQRLLELNIIIVKEMMKRNYASNFYLHYDIHAGPGKAPDGTYGSPLIFLRTAKRLGIKHHAHFYDCDVPTFEKLLDAVGDNKFANCHMKDHNEIINKLKLSKPDDRQYGTIYVDPSDTTLPIDLLVEFGRVFPKLDVIINFGCAGHKRACKLDGYVRLDEYLKKIKPHWAIRKPIGKHQWSMMIGSNFPGGYPAWERQGFYSTRNENGRELLQRLSYTKEDLR